MDKQTQIETIKLQTRLDRKIGTNIYRLQIRSKVIGNIENYGTGFTVFKDKKTYLVTAAHLLEGIHENDIGDSIFIQHDNKFKMVDVEAYEIGDYNIAEDDIVVFKVNAVSLHNKLVGKYIIEPHAEIVYIGEQIIFAGYPELNNQLDYKEDFDPNLHKGFPRPVLKFGYLSHFTTNPARYYIDGTPNFGFSGGPIMYRNKDNVLRYLGVVSRGTRDEGLGGLTMVCGKMKTVLKFIKEIEKKS